MNPSPENDRSLPPQFRKWDATQRRTAIAHIARESGLTDDDIRRAMGSDEDLIDLADAMIEASVGYAAIPFGVCRGLTVDGQTRDIPLVTEEPSVVAAATYAASITTRAGGFTTRSGDPITTGQLFIEDAAPEAQRSVLDAENDIRDAIEPVIRRILAGQ